MVLLVSEECICYVLSYGCAPVGCIGTLGDFNVSVSDGSIEFDLFSPTLNVVTRLLGPSVFSHSECGDLCWDSGRF